MVVEFLGKDVKFDKVVDTFDVHGPYCKEVEVRGTDDEGFVYSAIGFFDGEQVYLLHLVGMALIILGVYMVNRAKR